VSAGIRRFHPVALAVLLAACGGQEIPAGHHLASLSFPLVSTDVDARCRELIAERERQGRPPSCPAEAIEWAGSVDEAFARAAREDKPVLFTTYVRENADPTRDV
jgi:hypothetical protein